MARAPRIEFEGAVWVSREGLEATRSKITKLIAEEKDERIKIGIRVELGGEKLTAVARELGYGDGSGVHRVVQRLNLRAKEDVKIRAHLLRLRRATSKRTRVHL